MNSGLTRLSLSTDMAMSRTSRGSAPARLSPGDQAFPYLLLLFIAVMNSNFGGAQLGARASL